MKNNNYRRLFEDGIMILIGIILAVILVKIGILSKVVGMTNDYILASFISGIFFTSAFTLAPSSVVLIQIAEKAPTEFVVIFGALGALAGDLILFYFIRDRFSEDVKKVFKKSTLKHVVRSLHFGFLKWLAPILGALIIASPLPDEFGISLLGMSRVKVMVLIPLAFIMNGIGIYLLIKFSELV